MTTKAEIDLVAPKVAAELESWLRQLGDERRFSPKTTEAYRRDVLQFLAFLAEHLGGAPSLQDLAALEPADVRAFLAARRAEGIGSRSLMRALAGMRGFARFLERNGKGKVGALAAVRAPKIGKTLPRPLPAAAAKRVADPDLSAGDGREPWIHARDAAVLALLYGGGLRISEALGLKRGDFGGRDTVTVTGKGNKQRMVPVLPQVAKLVADYLALCPYDLGEDGPLFVGAKGGPLPARVVQLAMARLRGALGLPETATPHALAPFLRHAPPRPRRRSALDPGAPRPRFAGDDTDLHRSRRRAADRGLSQRASARLSKIRAIGLSGRRAAASPQ